MLPLHPLVGPTVMTWAVIVTAWVVVVAVLVERYRR